MQLLGAGIGLITAFIWGSADTIATLAFTEPNGRWDADGIEMTVTGKYRLDGVKSFVLDPNLFPATGMQFSVEPEQTAMHQLLGPYAIDKAETIDLVIPTNAAESRISIHHTFR